MTADLNLYRSGQMESIHSDIRQTKDILGSIDAKLTEAGIDPLPASAEMPDMFPKLKDWHAIPLGIGCSGSVVEWDLRKAQNMLITGTTGSGRSVAAKTICAGAAASGHRLVLVDAVRDGQGFDWISEDYMFCERIALGLESAHETIAQCYEELSRRMALNSEHSVAKWSDLPSGVRPRPMLMLIEEFWAMTETGGVEAFGSEEETETKRAIRFMCETICRSATTCGIHIAVTAQRPSRHDLCDLKFSAALQARLLLGAAGDAQRDMVLMDPSAAPKLEGNVPAGRGVFMQDSSYETVQIFYPGDTLELSIRLIRGELRIKDMAALDNKCLPPPSASVLPSEEQEAAGGSNSKRSGRQKAARGGIISGREIASESEPVQP